MNEKELLKLKEKINNAKSEVSELKGQEKYLIKELKENWNCDSIEAAKKTLKKLEVDVLQINQKIDEGIQELEEKYNV